MLPINHPTKLAKLDELYVVAAGRAEVAGWEEVLAGHVLPVDEGPQQAAQRILRPDEQGIHHDFWFTQFLILLL